MKNIKRTILFIFFAFLFTLYSGMIYSCKEYELEIPVKTAIVTVASQAYTADGVSWSRLDFNNELFDTNNYHAQSGGDTTKLTLPNDGFHQFFFEGNFSEVNPFSTKRHRVRVIKNGNEILLIDEVYSPTAITSIGFIFSFYEHGLINDYYQIEVFSDISGGPVIVTVINPTFSIVEMK